MVCDVTFSRSKLHHNIFDIAFKEVQVYREASHQSERDEINRIIELSFASAILHSFNIARILALPPGNLS